MEFTILLVVLAADVADGVTVEFTALVVVLANDVVTDEVAAELTIPLVVLATDVADDICIMLEPFIVKPIAQVEKF